MVSCCPDESVYVRLCHTRCDLSGFISGCCHALIKICQQMATLQQKGFSVQLSSGGLCSSHAHHRYSAPLWVCRWLPSVPSLFPLEPLVMNLFLLREVYLSLASMKAEPLASCSSDEKSWAALAASPRPLHQRDWALLFYPVVCSWTPAPTSSAAAAAPCASSGPHIFHTHGQSSKSPRTFAVELLEHMRLSSVCSVLPRPWPQIRPRVGLQRECRGVVLTRGEREHSGPLFWCLIRGKGR